jgi:hypothetical protein
LSFYTGKLRKGLTTYNLALKDILNPPSIQKIDTTGYHGKPGEKIRVTAYDIFALAKVTVRIVHANGSIGEQGVCAYNLSPGTYDYSATTEVSNLSGVTVKATAHDMPGNETVKITALE